MTTGDHGTSPKARTILEAAEVAALAPPPAADDDGRNTMMTPPPNVTEPKPQTWPIDPVTDEADAPAMTEGDR